MSLRQSLRKVIHKNPKPPSPGSSSSLDGVRWGWRRTKKPYMMQTPHVLWKESLILKSAGLGSCSNEFGQHRLRTKYKKGLQGRRLQD